MKLRSKPKRIRRLCAVLALVTAQLASSPGPASATGPYVFWFVKNTSDRLNSRLFWTNLAWTEGDSWRAGSGRNMDECRKSDDPAYPPQTGGWLPNGTWTVQFASANYNGSVIKGPAIRFYDHVCSNGITVRNEIFIHSKIPWPTGGEYMSQGCVKVSSTGSNPASAGGDVRYVYDVRAFLSINTMYVS